MIFSNGSITDLNPGSSYTSAANAIVGVYSVFDQVGWFQNNIPGGGSPQKNAAFWSGTSSSLQNLHPSNFTSSWGNSIATTGTGIPLFCGGGVPNTTTLSHALLWTDSMAGTWTISDLNALCTNTGGVNTDASTANAITPDGTVIAGFFSDSYFGMDKSHACVWIGPSGNPGTFLDLDAGDTTGFSNLFGAYGKFVVGRGAIPNTPAKGGAIYWYNSQTTANPLYVLEVLPGGNESCAFAIAPNSSGIYLAVGGEQDTSSALPEKPVYWTPVDPLHPTSATEIFLPVPPGYTGGRALAISADSTIITGYLIDSSGNTYAAEWTGTP